MKLNKMTNANNDNLNNLMNKVNSMSNEEKLNLFKKNAGKLLAEKAEYQTIITIRIIYKISIKKSESILTRMRFVNILFLYRLTGRSACISNNKNAYR